MASSDLEKIQFYSQYTRKIRSRNIREETDSRSGTND